VNTKIRLRGGLIKIGEFLDQMNNCDLFKIDPEPWSLLRVRKLLSLARIIESDCVSYWMFCIILLAGGKNGSL
jgi:hypothetical protein